MANRVSRPVLAGALVLAALVGACSSQDGLVPANGVTMNGASSAHLATPAAIIPVAGNVGTFANNTVPANTTRASGGAFWDNISADGTSGAASKCNVGFFVVGTMDATCNFAKGSSNANIATVGAVFAGGTYWGLQGNPILPAGFMFSGATKYTVSLVGGYRNGDSEIGWFTIDGLGVYHFNAIPTFATGPDAAPVVIDPAGANWGFYYTNTFLGHQGGGCGGTVDHYCSNANGGVPTNPIDAQNGIPNQQQFALFTNTTGSQFVVAVEDNQLELPPNGLNHDSDYQDYIFTVAPIAAPVIADVSVTKTGATTATTGQQVTYTITGKNNGPSAAANVIVQDTLPVGATFVSASNGGTQAAGVVTWPTVASLASGASTAAYTVTVTYATANSYKDNAHVFTTTTESNPNNNHADLTTVVTTPRVVALFVIGDVEAHKLGDNVNFWGAQWWKNNDMSGIVSNGVASFKGYADQSDGVCGGTWTSLPGNSSNPPDTIGADVAIIVTSTVLKNGNNISGNIKQIVIVHQDGGYGPNPGHRGNGPVTSIVCTAP